MASYRSEHVHARGREKSFRLKDIPARCRAIPRFSRTTSPGSAIPTTLTSDITAWTRMFCASKLRAPATWESMPSRLTGMAPDTLPRSKHRAAAANRQRTTLSRRAHVRRNSGRQRPRHRRCDGSDGIGLQEVHRARSRWTRCVSDSIRAAGHFRIPEGTATPIGRRCASKSTCGNRRRFCFIRTSLRRNSPKLSTGSMRGYIPGSKGWKPDGQAWGEDYLNEFYAKMRKASGSSYGRRNLARLQRCQGVMEFEPAHRCAVWKDVRRHSTPVRGER